MFEKIVDILHKFFEKYFIQTIVAIPLTILIYYFVPADFEFIQKVGNLLFLLFVYCCLFLLEVFVIWCYKKYKYQKYTYNYNTNLEHQKKEHCIEKVKDFVDGLEPSEKRTLYYFLNNNNSEILWIGSYDENKVFDTLCNSCKSVVEEDIKSYDPISDSYITFKKRMPIYKLKLKDEIYSSFTAFNKENNLSNFN